jgi:hypothetical protein
LQVKYADGSLATLESTQVPDANFLKIKMQSKTFEIDEAKGRFTQDGVISDTFRTPYQSELTQVAANEIFSTGRSMLPTYEESKKQHLVFLESLLKFRNSFAKEALDFLPIT